MFRFSVNRSEEIRAMRDVVAGEYEKARGLPSKQRLKRQRESLLWFFDQVSDLVDRQEAESVKGE